MFDERTRGGRQDPLTPVKLKNGTEEVGALVLTTTMSVNSLLERGLAIPAYELVQLCRDGRHRPFGSCGETLEKLGLVQKGQDGSYSVHDSIRNIVLSMASGEGLEMTFGSPVAK
jgi:hypothetical protein